ncbi:MAG: bifunctional aspartate kinase/homoserine dehydrogenase I [Acidobacteriota bacterium]|nr:bifunctional aspartate kinase/homoserine dehydrogenase I [Acidobacteriota bacterium]
MRVLKFGGSSVASPERVEAVVAIVRKALEAGPVTVVVSAFGGVTDTLLAAAQAAAQEATQRTSRGQASPAADDDSDAAGGWRGRWEALAQRHRQADERSADEAEQTLAEDREQRLEELHDLLHGISLVGEVSPRTLDSVLSYGERLSAPTVAAALRRAGVDAEACDSRPLIVTDGTFGNAQVDLESTYQRLREHFSNTGPRVGRVQVMTGFIAATAAGETTTLGRGGSDYTASLMGAALDADAVELWTDVDGVMSADPRLVPGARPIRRLSYEELMELSHFGAKVVYPPSVHPTRSAGIPLWIRNTFHPEAPGTRVDDTLGRQSEGSEASRPPVRGITSIQRFALLRLEGDGMVGVPGIAMRLFAALARERINVILITQASSEHSICIGISPESIPSAVRCLAEEFALERRAGLVDELVVEDNLAVVAAVGTGMRDRPGIASSVFGVLAERDINVRAIAQGSSELNISVVVSSRDEARAVRALHSRFFQPLRRVDVHLAGVGRVGAALLTQLARSSQEIARRRGLELRLVAVANSRGVLGDPAGLDPATAAEELARQTAAGEELRPLAEHLEDLARRPRPAVFLDCTADPTLGALYRPLLEAGVSVVTANKHPFAGPLDQRPPAGPLYHEATVGAGLPVIGPLRDLADSGDGLQAVEGVLSGTVGFVLSRLHDGAPFSQALREAYDQGLTEPDPREDLEGGDVGRKLLILARLGGFDLEPEEVVVEPLLPADGPWSQLTLEQLWERLPELDPVFAQRLEEAGDSRLVYLARFDGERATVGLEALPPQHPAASLRGTENLVVLKTGLYDREPLIVRGPGAGPAVTAGGVFADLLRAAAEWRSP